MIREYVVAKKILNVRSKPSDESDDTFVGQLLEGTRVWLDDTEIIGTIPKGGTSNIWLGDHRNNLVAKDGVVEASKFWIQKYGIDSLWHEVKGENVTVIIIDSGLSDYGTGRFAAEKLSVVTDGANDKFGHGSLMCSIIKGHDSDIQGIAPLSSIISIKVTSDSHFKPNDLVNALTKVSEVANRNNYYVVNCSLSTNDNSIKNELQNKIDDLSNNYNMIFTGAVGNDFDYVNDLQIMPARVDKVISVAGETLNGLRIQSSNYWENIDCLSPGEFNSDIFHQSFPGCPLSGSSQACAFTTGLIALFLSKAFKKNRKLKHGDIKQLLFSSTDSFTTDTQFGVLTDRILNKDKLQTTFSNI